MGIYIEAIILYVVLFFSGTAIQLSSSASQAAGFSVAAEIAKIMLYCIPSLALIWYLTIKSWKLEYWSVRPGKKDLISGLITFPCLLLTSFIVANISKYAGDNTTQAIIYSPTSAFEWVILCISCLFAAYLEESFFRFYLISRRQELNLNATSALILSVALFSVCHIHEGPWGFLNSVLAGVFLAFMFLRYNSLHGIAVAHALYNITVYVLNSIVN